MVARLGSFSAAAEKLNITQPAVTLQVKALEEAHDTQLFLRQANKVSLTSAGLELMALTRRMFETEDEIRNYLQDHRTLESGELVLGADGPHVALDLVSRFQQLYPGIHIRLSLGNAAHVWRDLVEHRVDAAVMANPGEDSRIYPVTLATSGMMAVLPKGHVLSERQKVGLRDLAEYPLILREQGSNTRRRLEEVIAREKIQLNPFMELGSREAVKEAVALGMGIGFAFAREIVGDERITAVPIRELQNSNQDTLTVLVKKSSSGSDPSVGLLRRRDERKSKK